MIKKVKNIKDYAVFNNFDWNNYVRDKGNNIGEFKKLNIIYGRNYSGKTTLSRIFRSFEKGVLHEKYPNSEFGLEHSGTQLLNQVNLQNHNYTIRVYNKDFVTDNLKCLISSEGSIEPFAIIGEKNVDIGNKIREKENSLGNESSKAGLKYDHLVGIGKYEQKKDTYDKTIQDLESKLRDKANNDIKRNPLYGEVTYNINSIKSDIEMITKHPRHELTEKEILDKKSLLKEQARKNIPTIIHFKPSFRELYKKSEQMLKKQIKPSKPIQELLNDAILQEWVRDGIKYHKEKREYCAFCGSVLSVDLWDKLEAHFNKESETFRGKLNQQISSLEEEKDQINEVINLSKGDFYSTFREECESKFNEWKVKLNQYISNIDSIIKQLKKREQDIFNIKKIIKLKDNSKKIIDLQVEIADLILMNNQKTTTLTKDQSHARKDLRLNEILLFTKGIDCYSKQKEIVQLKTEMQELNRDAGSIAEMISMIENEIEELKLQLKDERKGAEKVNEYLNHYFGYDGLKLVATEDEEDSGFRFKIFRGEEAAFNLSEGECSLVAFCYFMAKLEDTETKGKDLIIWIDDPVSSLDSNHIFFVFSLIENVITKPYKKEDGSKAFNYKQLFISTHNLDFLKYLKRLSHPKNETEYFLIDRIGKNSRIILMPSYLKKYITEFNYLFHQIYKCSIVENVETEHDCFYNFGNNLRKFLEAYLFYKYPANIKIQEKLNRFFSDDELSVDLANRIGNELSHLEGSFDRSMKPIEIPEIPKLARYVLNKIKEKDEEQYSALLKSIGIE